MIRPLLALALVTPTLAQGVRIVERPDLYLLPDLQTAIDLAQDGDTILVEDGVYAPFVIDGRSLSVLAMPAASIQIQGTVEVRDLPAAGAVVLRGLQVTGDTKHWGRSEPGLSIRRCKGHVRVLECQLFGGEAGGGWDDQVHGGHGARVLKSPRTAFVRSMMIGADGFSPGSGVYDADGGHGGDGLRANANVALYDCSLLGGQGGDTGREGGNGGHGLHLQSGAQAFVSGTPMTGGDGGFGDDFIYSRGGRGGDGVRVDGGHAGLLDSPTIAGKKGFGFIIDGTPGEPIFLLNGGTVTQHAGAARRFEAEVVKIEESTLTVDVTGEVGDEVRLLMGRHPGFAFPGEGIGARLVPGPVLTPIASSGTVDGTQTLTFQVDLGHAPSPKVELFLQGHVLDSGGERILASPLHLCVLDRDSLPDCNGNGVSDLVDLLTGSSLDADRNLNPDECDGDCNGNGIPDQNDIQSGTSSDCNGNGVPDECDLAFGGAQDCNANGVLDECDLASGDSQDLNGNDVPDECDPHAIYYVDAAAAPGGDGSQLEPFQAIAEALAVASDLDEILVLDGVYSGPDNRELDLGGRNLTLRSLNGSASCVLDCQLLGRAFLANDFEVATIEGFTIRQGRGVNGFSLGGALQCSGGGLTLRDCYFEDCSATAGGAIYTDGPIRIEDCTFQDCHAAGSGGAVYINPLVTLPATPVTVITRTLFLDCSGKNGGAIEDLLRRTTVISQCTFNGCAADERGGALRSFTSLWGPTATGMFLHECRFLNNQAQRGGAVELLGTTDSAIVHGCTFTANSATQRGGALTFQGGSFNPPSGSLRLVNSILWGNTAGIAGDELALFNFVSVEVDYCDVQGGAAAAHVHADSLLAFGLGNIDLDPQFETAHLGLALSSPCIDAGDNAAVPRDRADVDGDENTDEETPWDAVLQDRRVDIPSVGDTGSGSSPVIDMGAMERQD